MRQLMQTNDPVLLSFVESLLSDAGIKPAIFDRNMSVLEGSIGVLPRRILVPSDDLNAAMRIMREAGLGEWIDDQAQ